MTILIYIGLIIAAIILFNLMLLIFGPIIFAIVDGITSLLYKIFPNMSDFWITILETIRRFFWHFGR